MNTLRFSFPRVATALLAVAVLGWCLLQAIPFDASASPAPNARNALLAGGAIAAPLAVPFLTLLVGAARD
ncbi:MAG: hypothetical protein C0518_10705 [Opitutus sp.]|nr:hypothetical protein [Opitutus sp.]